MPPELIEFLEQISVTDEDLEVQAENIMQLIATQFNDGGDLDEDEGDDSDDNRPSELLPRTEDELDCESAGLGIIDE